MKRTKILLVGSHATVILHEHDMSTTIPKPPQFPVRFFPAMADETVDLGRGRRVEELMTAVGWKPSALARALRVDRGRIYGWKSGQSISPDMLERLAVALETTRRYIETGEGEPHYPRGDPPALLLKQLADALAEPGDAGD